MPNGDNGRGGLGTVRNAVTLLELLADGPAYHQLTDLAERSSMSIPTVHRLLRSLVLADLAVQDPATSRYGLGPELARLSHHYLTRLPLVGAVSPYLAQVRDKVGATVHVEILVRGEVVYVDRVDGGTLGPYRESNRVHAALDTAGGRVLAARAAEEEWEHALRLTTPEMRGIAEKARAEWVAAEWLAHEPEDMTMPSEVAVPVLDATGAAVGAISADVPDAGDTEHVAAAAAYLGRAAKAAGRTLGHG
ncbi:IclR family transcriptional regulator [Ornithinimicrobium panacihumi]|uniref:IclR family transcriptional regulator n=1 Tax=Ornithinimicrobium panacihumi TaxID=2008449 RepID=UPI003F8B0386